MLNASRCRSMSADYARRAAEARDPAAQRAFRRLEILWREMAPLAENFDRWIVPGRPAKRESMLA